MPCCAIASDLPPVWIEVGPTAMHYTPDKIDTNAGMYHVTTSPADHALAATGGRLRLMVHIQDGWYFGVEGDLAYFSGPSLDGQWLARSGTMMTTSLATHGDIQQGKFVVGKRFVFGDRWMFASELAPGLQIAQYTSTDIPNFVEPWTQSWYVLEAHALGGAWLTNRLSLTVEASADITHPDRLQLALLIGGHLGDR
jgi:hypothetical protein